MSLSVTARDGRPAYVPILSVQAHATILFSTARTTLTQKYLNPHDHGLKNAAYTFPLYDGVSVVDFKCHVGTRTLHSQVKTREQAKTDYSNAVVQGRKAALMERFESENDKFLIRLGNVEANEIITVEITFIGELKQDSQTDGTRYTLPNVVAPRYQNLTGSQVDHSAWGIMPHKIKEISITVDVLMEKTCVLRALQSPSHPIKVSLGRISSTTAVTSAFDASKASATLILTQENPFLERDFVMVINADGLDTPRAFLETHPTIPNQRAVMATLVPKFHLPPAMPELIFIIDRSGSMHDKIPTLQSALKVFLKSLPVGIRFNICSFGQTHSLLWPTSRIYSSESLDEALQLVNTIKADMGGTELLSAVKSVVASRLKNTDLEVLVLTDGQIVDQPSLFTFVRNSASDNSARFFSLGIGDAASHSLVEGMARAGNGIPQMALQCEELDRKVVRMLKGALSPHIYDYKLEVEYDAQTDSGFDMMEDAETLPPDSETEVEDPSAELGTSKQPILLFDENFEEPVIDLSVSEGSNDLVFAPPRAIQAPHKIPTLYPFIRTTAYLLMDSESCDRAPKALTFRASSKQGPLQLRIPIQDLGKSKTVHQLAARKAVIELEEEHGWLADGKDRNGILFSKLDPHTKTRIATRECHHLGLKFQITGKYCSFVAVEENSTERSESHNQQSQPKEREATVLPRQEPRLNRFSQMMCMRTVPAGATGGPLPAPSSRGPSGGGGLFGGSTPSSVFASTATPPQASSFGSFQHSGGLFGNTTAPLNAPQASLSQLGSPSSSGGLYGMDSRLPRASYHGGPMVSQAPRSPAPSSLFGGSGALPSFGDSMGASAVQPSTNPVPDMLDLLNLQTFQGNWEWTPSLFTHFDHTGEEIKERLGHIFNNAGHPVGPDFPSGDEAQVIATLLAMGYLRKKRLDSKEVWGLIYHKAEDWLSCKAKEKSEIDEMIQRHKSTIMFGF